MIGRSLNLKSILGFWLPLEATWLMMGVEGPFLAGIVARLGNPVDNLAAFGCAFSLAWLVESPVIMLLSASTALVRDREGFLALRRFTFLLIGTLTGLLALLALPWVFTPLAERALGMPPEVARLAHLATVLLIPWPAAIGYRRFYQGLLVQRHLGRKVALGTLFRVGSMGLAAGATVLALDDRIPGACVGSLGLTAAVVTEAVATRWMVRHIVRDLLAPGPSGPAPAMASLVRFYFPLALTSIITMSTGPLLTLFLGRGQDAVPCIAVWHLVYDFVFFFRSGGGAFQEVGVALCGTEDGHAVALRRAAVFLAVLSSGLMVAVVLSPLGALWFRGVVGLTGDLLPFALLPAQFLILLPAMEALLGFQRSRWISARRTRFVSAATALEMGGIVLGMVLFALVLGWRGTLAAALSLTLGRMVACGYLLRKARLLPS
ncbi:hypothetical protein [Mesoterricola silvestris]|nr:hypothetical protein [Mesoterricola silvestris]